MTYNSLFAAGLIDATLHAAIAEHPDSIQIQALLCQSLLLSLLFQLSAYPQLPARLEIIKSVLTLESWTDIHQKIKKVDQTLAQNLVESVKRVQFVLLNQLPEEAE